MGIAPMRDHKSNWKDTPALKFGYVVRFCLKYSLNAVTGSSAIIRNKMKFWKKESLGLVVAAFERLEIFKNLTLESTGGL